MTRISELPTLVSAPSQASYDDRIAVLKREIVEAMDPPSDGSQFDPWQDSTPAEVALSFAE